MSYLPDHYRATNMVEGHKSDCAWGAGGDCNCGKHVCDGCGGSMGTCICGMDDDDDDGGEAMQEGMAHGVEAYNEAAGRGTITGPPDCPTCLRPMEAGHHGCDCAAISESVHCADCGDEYDEGDLIQSPFNPASMLCECCYEDAENDMGAEARGFDDHDGGDSDDYDESYRPVGGADLWWDKESGEPRCG